MAKVPINREKARISERKYQEKNKELLREKALKYYHKNKEKIKERLKNQTREQKDRRNERRRGYRIEVVRWINEMKLKEGCKICGTKEKLQYHHRDPKEKLMAISTMISREKSKELILKEIEKCDILCKPCHDKEHTQFTDEERKERRAKLHKRWRAKNFEHIKEYKEKNRTRILEGYKKYRSRPEVKERKRETNRLWRQNNKDKTREYDRRKWEKQKLKKQAQ